MMIMVISTGQSALNTERLLGRKWWARRIVSGRQTMKRLPQELKTRATKGVLKPGTGDSDQADSNRVVYNVVT